MFGKNLFVVFETLVVFLFIDMELYLKDDSQQQ
jgi:hypothetical protein